MNLVSMSSLSDTVVHIGTKKEQSNVIFIVYRPGTATLADISTVFLWNRLEYELMCLLKSLSAASVVSLKADFKIPAL